MTFRSPANDIQFKISLAGFVDDSTLVIGGSATETMESLLQKATHDAQLFNDLIFSTGGVLKLDKTSFHVVQYKFESNGLPRMLHQPTKTLTLTNHHSTEFNSPDFLE